MGYSSFCHFQEIQISSGDYPVVSSFHFDDIDVICGLTSLCFREITFWFHSIGACVLVLILKVGLGLIRMFFYGR